jgi:hypothetical protein
VDARMELWGELFSDSVGVMSALVIGFMIFMAIWFTWYFISHMMKYSEKMGAASNSNTREKNREPDAPS